MKIVDELLKTIPEKMQISFQEIKKEKKWESKKEKEEDTQFNKEAQNYLSKNLWKWKENEGFKFKIPNSIFRKEKVIGELGNRYSNEKVEYEDETRKGKGLSEEELKQIWEKGQFSINSKVKELPYTWKLSNWLVKGSENIQLRYLKDMSISFGLLYSIKGIFDIRYYMNLRQIK